MGIMDRISDKFYSAMSFGPSVHEIKQHEVITAVKVYLNSPFSGLQKEEEPDTESITLRFNGGTNLEDQIKYYSEELGMGCDEIKGLYVTQVAQEFKSDWGGKMKFFLSDYIDSNDMQSVVDGMSECYATAVFESEKQELQTHEIGQVAIRYLKSHPSINDETKTVLVKKIHSLTGGGNKPSINEVLN